MLKATNTKSVLIKNKLIQVQLLSAFFVLMTCSLGFLINDVLIFKKSVERNLESTARILGRNLVPALVFSDQKEAKKIITSLESEPSIDAAYVFDSKGVVFSRYGKNTDVRVPTRIPTAASEISSLSGSHLIFQYRLDQGREAIGWIYLDADLNSFSSEYKKYISIFMIVVISGLFLSFVVANFMQEALSKPISELAQTAKNIAESEDYSLRMQLNSLQSGITEMNTLYAEFNQMLDQIELKEQKIRLEKDNAEKANQAKTLFLANMSHELRAPMHGILSFARLVKSSQIR